MKGGQTMKETIKTSRTAGYLEKIFRAVNIICGDCMEKMEVAD